MEGLKTYTKTRDGAQNQAREPVRSEKREEQVKNLKEVHN